MNIHIAIKNMHKISGILYIYSVKSNKYAKIPNKNARTP